MLGRPVRRGTRKRVMTCTNAGASPAWPGVSTKAGGLQRLSAARWILVVSPPRERPRAWSAGSPFGPLLTGPGGVLVSADDRGVDGDDPVEVAFGVGLGEQGGEDPRPGPVRGPHTQAVVGALPRAEVLGQVHPLRPGAVLERDRVDHLPVNTPPPTPPRCPGRQQRLDPCPLGVSQRHTSTSDPTIRRKRPRRPGPGTELTPPETPVLGRRQLSAGTARGSRSSTGAPVSRPLTDPPAPTLPSPGAPRIGLACTVS